MEGDGFACFCTFKTALHSFGLKPAEIVIEGPIFFGEIKVVATKTYRNRNFLWLYPQKVAAERGDGKVFLMVTYRIDEPATLQRKKSPCCRLQTNTQKYILTIDNSLEGNTEGIIIEYLPECLTVEI